MEMGGMEEEVFFVNELDLDEELEAEIARTEAAIDHCFQSRPKRAGIAVSGLRDRCMSEEERDLLSEKLGTGSVCGPRERRR